MIHQMAADLIGIVGDTCRRRFGPRVQQQARRLDRVAREYLDSTAGDVAGAVGPAKANRRNATSVICLNECRRSALAKRGAIGFGPVEMDGGVVLRAYQADRNAGAAAATCGSVLVVLAGLPSRCRRGRWRQRKLGIFTSALLGSNTAVLTRHNVSGFSVRARPARVGIGSARGYAQTGRSPDSAPTWPPLRACATPRRPAEE